MGTTTNYRNFHDYDLEISRNHVYNAKVIHLFGRNVDVDLGSLQELSDQGGVRRFLTSAETLYLSSTSAGDSQAVIISGLDTNYDAIQDIVILNGQTQVATNLQFITVETMQGISPTKPIGEVYLASANSSSGGIPTVQAEIQLFIMLDDDGISHNITQALYFTVPRGQTGYLWKARVFTGKNKDAKIFFNIKPFGLAEITPSGFDIYQTAVEFDVNPNIQLPEKTSIRVTASTTNNNTPIGIGLELRVLNSVDNVTPAF